jgi:CubicO group peptidase (beta-lactamase class C family)
MLDVYPIVTPEHRPVYSNIAFTIFVYALEEATGKNYTTLLEEYVTAPLDMQNTVVSPGDSSKAVIPPVENSWGSNYADNAP